MTLRGGLVLRYFWVSYTPWPIWWLHLVSFGTFRYLYSKLSPGILYLTAVTCCDPILIIWVKQPGSISITSTSFAMSNVLLWTSSLGTGVSNSWKLLKYLLLEHSLYYLYSIWVILACGQNSWILRSLGRWVSLINQIITSKNSCRYLQMWCHSVLPRSLITLEYHFVSFIFLQIIYSRLKYVSCHPQSFRRVTWFSYYKISRMVEVPIFAPSGSFPSNSDS